MTNLAKRIIPCLDIKDGRVVKGVNFIGLKDAGNPIDVAKRYNDSGADELVFLDINASFEGRKATLKVIESIARQVFIPLSVGGGIATLSDISDLLNAGCDKVSLNSAALNRPDFINEAAQKFGSQCVVVAVDVKQRSDGSIGVFTHGGRKDSAREMVSWLKEAQSRGAGEILLTSMDSDGTKSGFDLSKLSKALESCNLPIIASGGAGSMQHILDAFEIGVDAALAASIFHYGEIEIMDLKHFLAQNGVKVRI
ncbi:imidazole glycerol phosphate synthase subunit HisF [Helicobacter saguini]|uniref:Imidazole glycerol phosphate synthase subunit HisF n=1 Tax=Helicobacter saguini TaxID=1548018 RepID=A0A347VNB5_9HELI|nr:imidazole glycerol phosphate synthase subunit HisF [Helicobacter saguini]MWV61830.1 imidazole glycerol phosphate synthase subunit HisF [Helicobacter saguini]MWV67495.1 imidazole glycerol phosphate synthase subunit HisF [Helicobacter saguini]MWV69846.1 imidazole glycerol phosphate synthase subunit HisF [Helicobacter saguini]MWV72936.1 imidazole glycerol phosphate synthase subunit HisF [Helicobacter saguini]TLD95680.1 imidazole glycerol phosphate synthase subunit HisF [Helicobacter saguini]